MKQINLEKGSPVSLAAQASCEGLLMPPLAAPLSLLGGRLWRLGGTETSDSLGWALLEARSSFPSQLWVEAGSVSRELCERGFQGDGNPHSYTCFTKASQSPHLNGLPSPFQVLLATEG